MDKTENINCQIESNAVERKKPIQFILAFGFYAMISVRVIFKCFFEIFGRKTIYDVKIKLKNKRFRNLFLFTVLSEGKFYS